MPWRNYYYKRRRRYWNNWWGARRTFRRKRRWRRRQRWVRPKRKLKTLLLKEYQPSSINKCKIKGVIPLLWTTPERFINNYDLYELSTAPEKIPSGGGFSIKNFSLLTLFAEHNYVRNIWTKTNKDKPLVRYTGCRLKFYHSDNMDYVVSYDTNLPLKSSIDMYHSMHPGIHTMLQHKKIIPCKKTSPRTKPYTILKLKPPTPLQNKWYFQQDLYKTPLLQIRTSSLSIDQYYLPHKSISSTITITFLNSGLLQNTKFKDNSPNGYFASGSGTNTVQLWYCPSQPTEETQKNTLTFLGNTDTYTAGTPATKLKYTYELWGNPFHSDYLTRKKQVYQSKLQLATLISQWEESHEKLGDLANTYGFTPVFLTDAIRYNPFRDHGEDNSIYFKSIIKNENGWDIPEKEDLVSIGYPLWVLNFGFADFQKKLGKLLRIDTEHILVMTTHTTSPKIRQIMPIIDNDFIRGNSPFEKGVSPQDITRWHPCYQYQTQMSNTIAYSGPGSPKLPPLESGECKMAYSFYFKWGGNPPPMDKIEDPKDIPSYPMPSNLIGTNSLQNPASHPENVLWTFDERRGFITEKAIKRLQRDWSTEKSFITDADQRTMPLLQTKEETPETSESEAEETTQDLLLKLKQQRYKQQQLKFRIIQQLKKLQKLE